VVISHETSSWGYDDEEYDEPPCAGNQPRLDGQWTQWRTTQSDIYLLAQDQGVEVIYSSRAMEGLLAPAAVPVGDE
jgi:hypothetical protein